MADAGLVLRQTMTAIASAIRTKGGAAGNLRPSEMAQAILAIPTDGGGGGGGDLPLYTQAQWDALTYAQKTATPFAAIRTSNSTSDLDIGELYQTSAILHTDMLPSSDASKILTIAEGILKSDGSWGNGTQRIRTNGQCSQAEDGSILVDNTNTWQSGVNVAYGSSTGSPFTAYIVAKVSEDTDGILGSNNEHSSNWAGVVLRYENGSVTSAKDYGSSTPITPAITASSGYFVACIRGSGTTESCAAILVGTSDTPTFYSYTIQKTGKYMGIGCVQDYSGNSTRYRGKLNVKFFGLVSEAESDAVVTSNMLFLAEAFAETSRYLPSSDISKISCLATQDNFAAGASSWGSGSNPIQISQGSLAQNADNSIAVNTKSGDVRAYVDLGASDTPFTAYIVAKLTYTNSNYTRLLSAMASRGAAQGILLYGRTNIYVSSWGSDTGTGLAPTNWFVGVIRYGGTGQALGGVCAVGSETVTLITKAPNTCGRYVTIGRTDIDASTSNAEPSDMNVLFMGVVSEAESDAVITENMKALSQAFASQSS